MHRSAGFVALTLGLLGLLGASAQADGGEALYASNCASCHGADGHAGTPVGKAMKIPSLVEPRWAAPDAADAIVAAFRANPKHKAVAGKVGDEDLRLIAAHVRGLAAAGQ